MNEDLIMASLARLEAGQGAMRSEFDSKFGGLSGRIDSIDARIDGLDARMDRLDGRMDGLRQEVTTLRVEVMARMDRLQDTLTGVQDDIGVNMGAVHAVHRAHENTRADVRGLQEQFSIMWRQLKTVEAHVRRLSGDA